MKRPPRKSLANRKADRIEHIPAILRYAAISSIRLSKFSAADVRGFRERMTTGARLSSLDLFGDRLVLLVGSNAEFWCTAAETSCRLHGLPVQRLVVERDLQDPKCAFLAAYGISETGAVLVRADGFVIWKTVRTNVFRHEDLLKVLIAAREVAKPVETIAAAVEP